MLNNRQNYSSVEFVSARVSYIVLRGRWCNIIVLNVHAPSEEKSDESKDSFYEELKQVFYNFCNYRKEIKLENFNAKVGKKIFSNWQYIKKNLVLKSTVFLHWIIHKYTWTSPDVKTHYQIDHLLIERRWQSSILDLWSFRAADCDTHTHSF